MKARRPAVVGLCFAVALAIAWAGPIAAAGNAVLRFEPAAVAAATGQTFVVQVVQDTPVQASGAQASVDFDPRILQVVSVTPGAGYTLAPIFVPKDLTAVIARANRTGHLAQIAAAYTPPGAVPAGQSSFLVVEFRVAGCGVTELGLPVGPNDAQMISGESGNYGAEIPVRTTGGRVTTCVAPDAVTATATGTTPVTPPAGSGMPWALIGALVIVAGGLLVAVAWQLRRRRRPVRPMRQGRTTS